MEPTRLLLAYGGRSSEHEISVRSARSILAAIDRRRFRPSLLAIDRMGGLHLGEADTPLEVLLRDGPLLRDLTAIETDVVFPALHGPGGEDGTLQGFLETLGIAYVGSGVLASALCMHKGTFKHVVGSKCPNVPLVPFAVLRRSELATPEARVAARERLETAFGYPCFVKPANLGSSIGISKVTRREELEPALVEALRYDDDLLVEKGLASPREIEVAVLGNGDDHDVVSEPGEIILPPGVWYDYDTKYHHDVARYAIPADLPSSLSAQLRSAARAATLAAGVTGLARVDFLVTDDGVAYLNEINTMPGFTSISMYPKLMAHVGMSYTDLVTRLCELALSRHASRRQLRVDR